LIGAAVRIFFIAFKSLHFQCSAVVNHTILYELLVFASRNPPKSILSVVKSPVIAFLIASNFV